MASSTVCFTERGLRHQRGFTLLEALIAMVVLAGGLLAAYRFNSSAISYSAESNVRTYALTMAEGKLEELRNFQDSDDFNAIVVSSPVIPADDDVVAYGSSTLTRGWVVDGAYGNGDNPRKVDVTVSWLDKGGVNQSVVLSSIIWRNNPGKNGKELFLALNTDGKGVDDWGDSAGNIPSRPETDKVVTTDSPADDLVGYPPAPAGEPPLSYYDATFYGDIAFTDEGLASVDIARTNGAMNHGAASCETPVDFDYPALEDDGVTPVMVTVLASPLLYKCTVKGIPSGETWSGRLTFNAAGNSEVCDPARIGNSSYKDISFNDTTLQSLDLAVVVLASNGACQSSTN